ncbi:hypothetical protein [Pigmentiphaga kullae]|uniref:Uncharacterized protein n=1 Tax=Pigmentiphaga kullae TaxID=151784 RepID=A0A4Q7NNE7_9BURK|nr:hypothetical protein [Pigmentiphaga kullae]RZS86070.1 hypothetical protein EV675_2104 [Pigmentiphaga kullae]
MDQSEQITDTTPAVAPLVETPAAALPAPLIAARLIILHRGDGSVVEVQPGGELPPVSPRQQERLQRGGAIVPPPVSNPPPAPSSPATRPSRQPAHQRNMKGA